LDYGAGDYGAVGVGVEGGGSSPTEAGSGLILAFPAGREYGRDFFRMSGQCDDARRRFALSFQCAAHKFANCLPSRGREFALPTQGNAWYGQRIPPSEQGFPCPDGVMESINGIARLRFRRAPSLTTTPHDQPDSKTPQAI
jgi:hypothetical protein